MSDSAPTGSKLVFWIFTTIGLIATVAVIYLAVMVFAFNERNRTEPAQIEAKAAKQVFGVAEVNALRGTNLNEIVIATAVSLQAGRDPYSSGGGRVDERNVILLDKASGESRKLLPDNNRQIIDREYLPAVVGESEANKANAYDGPGELEPKKPEPPAAYYLFRVRSGVGKEDVLVGELATGRQAFLLTGIDGVDKVWMQSPTRVALLMRKDRKLNYRAIEIPQLKVVAARPVEID